MTDINYNLLISNRDTEGSIKNWANDSRVPSTTILKEAQDTIYRELRVRQMLKTASPGSLAINTDTITLPTDYRQRYFFMFTATATVAKSIPRPKLLDFVLSNFTWDAAGARTKGRPQYYAIDEVNIQFENQALEAYPYLLKYYAQPADLGPNVQTNFLTDRYFPVLKAACLYKAFEHLRDLKWSQYWFAVAQGEIEKTNVDSDLEMSGMELEMQIDGGAGDGGLSGYGNL